VGEEGDSPQPKRVKVIDLGFAITYAKYEKSNTFWGTPKYMSPEIVRRVQFDFEKADVWALGVVLYVMIWGKFPFKEITNKDLGNKI
jgi:serine/threonine protein kinase